MLDSQHEVIASGIDVLVATPGRLVDHLKATPRFDLGHLRYLVLDEADGLLDQQFHGWLSAVLRACQSVSHAMPASWLTSSLPLVMPNLCLPTPPSPFPPQCSGYPFHSSLCSNALTTPSQPLQKLLFSATLTLDPEQLAFLKLHQPKLFSVAAVEGGEILGQSSLPSSLVEYAVPCTAELRPLALLHLLVSREHANSLCFTNSRETTHRLALLLKQFRKEVSVEELSSDTAPSQSCQVLKEFALGKIQVQDEQCFVSDSCITDTVPITHAMCRSWCAQIFWPEAWTSLLWTVLSITNPLNTFVHTNTEWVVQLGQVVKVLHILC